MCAPFAGQVLLSKLTTSLVGTKPEELSIATRSVSGLGATACGGLEGSGRRISRTGLALMVPLVDDSALVARDTGLGTGVTVTTALGPGAALGD